MLHNDSEKTRNFGGSEWQISVHIVVNELLANFSFSAGTFTEFPLKNMLL